MKSICKKTIKVISVMLMLVSLSACTENMDDLDKYILAVKARPADPIPPIPPVKTYTPYDYEGLTGRDPFRQSMTEGSDDVRSTAGTGPRPDFDRSKEYLERYELDTLSMVGTFSKAESEWVLLRDPEDIIHRVPVGDYLGKNHGHVVGITATQVSISELISDGGGGWLVREASIVLGDG
jgi:type IV pilus assembly protein PilP